MKMKIARSYTLDIELIEKLNAVGNASGLINELLWGYFNKQQPTTSLDVSKLSSQIDELRHKKSIIERENESFAKRQSHGIDDKLLLFLKAMNTSVMCAKDNKQAYHKLTGKTITWDALKQLKIDWA